MFIDYMVRSLFLLLSYFHTCWLDCHIFFLGAVATDQKISLRRCMYSKTLKSPQLRRQFYLFFDVIADKAHTVVHLCTSAL